MVSVMGQGIYEVKKDTIETRADPLVLEPMGHRDRSVASQVDADCVTGDHTPPTDMVETNLNNSHDRVDDPSDSTSLRSSHVVEETSDRNADEVPAIGNRGTIHETQGSKSGPRNLSAKRRRSDDLGDFVFVKPGDHPANIIRRLDPCDDDDSSMVFVRYQISGIQEYVKRHCIVPVNLDSGNDKSNRRRSPRKHWVEKPADDDRLRLSAVCQGRAQGLDTSSGENENNQSDEHRRWSQLTSTRNALDLISVNQGSAPPEVPTIGQDIPITRQSMNDLCAHDKTIKNIPGFAYEPFNDLKPLPTSYVQYLAMLPIRFRIQCQQAMRAMLSILRSAGMDDDDLPLSIFSEAYPTYGLQRIAEKLNELFDKKGLLRFIDVEGNSIQCPSSPPKPYFLALFIDTEYMALESELFRRDWEVVHVACDFAALETHCKVVFPDFIYAKCQSDVSELLKILFWVRIKNPFVHIVVEIPPSTDSTRKLLRRELGQRLRIPFVVLGNGKQATELWINDHALCRKLFLRRATGVSGSSVLSHPLAQFLVQHINSECELRWPRACREEGVPVDQDSSDDEHDNNPGFHIRNGSNLFEPDEVGVVLLPFIFRKDPIYRGLRDDATKRRQYREFKSKLWHRVDCWSSEITQVWTDWSSSAEPYNLDVLEKRVLNARNSALYNSKTHHWQPQVGQFVRKMFGGEYHTGRVVSVLKPESSTRHDNSITSLVTYEDGETWKYTSSELSKIRQGRDRIPAPENGRPFRFCELFSGRGVVTESMFRLHFRVQSFDIEPTSNATDVMDIMSLRNDHIQKELRGVPDAIWASPPCETYSNLKGGTDRARTDHEKTSLALNHNYHLLKIIESMVCARQQNPSAIFVIENPVGAMARSPLMILAQRLLNLWRVKVDYCTLGREEKKPTNLWTNDQGLAVRLQVYSCRNMCAHGGQHPSGVKTNTQVAHCVIPEPLATVIARYVDAKLESAGVRYTP